MIWHLQMQRIKFPLEQKSFYLNKITFSTKKYEIPVAVSKRSKCLAKYQTVPKYQNTIFKGPRSTYLTKKYQNFNLSKST